MIEKAVGRVRAFPAPGAVEFAILRGLGSHAEQFFGQAALFGQKGHGIRRGGHDPARIFQQTVKFVNRDNEPVFTQGAAVQPILFRIVKTLALQLFGRSQAGRVVKPEFHPGLQIFRGPVLALRGEPDRFNVRTGLHFRGAVKGRAAAAKAHQDSGAGQLAHGRLRD